ncbi:hypothetical protein Hypma_014493 [Hypsizygus marmoreus]|uniref:Uncharacterized protein n=1 Tax=Hypsizygus marmoreus TaxID=39966 RepID=A0A369JGN1_HYPMA|nr:hypothetical protein Hypma_014493 [Hypsizygus marmoreus]
MSKRSKNARTQSEADTETVKSVRDDPSTSTHYDGLRIVLPLVPRLIDEHCLHESPPAALGAFRKMFLPKTLHPFHT